jgi:RHS repeat-associated protein
MRTQAQAGWPNLRLLAATFWISVLCVVTASAQTTEVVTYYHTDAIGSVRMITDANGQVVERHDYLPFGEEWSAPSSSEGRLYTGKERDRETGFDYFGARYYASGGGRFTTVDPNHINGDIFDPQSWNGFAYARSNPLRFVDPFGFGECPASTDTSTCVEGTAGTNQLSFDYIRWLLGDILRSYWTWRMQDPGVMGGSPFVAPMSREGSLADIVAARSAAATLDAAVLRTFLGGQAERIVLQEDLTAIRVFDKIPGVTGGNSDMGGRFFSATRMGSRAQAQRELALGGFNQARFVESAVIPKGTVVYSGTAAPLGSLPGGATQIFVPNISEVRFYGIRPLP